MDGLQFSASLCCVELFPNCFKTVYNESISCMGQMARAPRARSGSRRRFRGGVRLGLDLHRRCPWPSTTGSRVPGILLPLILTLKPVGWLLSLPPLQMRKPSLHFQVLVEELELTPSSGTLGPEN